MLNGLGGPPNEGDSGRPVDAWLCDVCEGANGFDWGVWPGDVEDVNPEDTGVLGLGNACFLELDAPKGENDCLLSGEIDLEAGDDELGLPNGELGDPLADDWGLEAAAFLDGAEDCFGTSKGDLDCVFVAGPKGENDCFWSEDLGVVDNEGGVGDPKEANDCFSVVVEDASRGGCLLWNPGCESIFPTFWEGDVPNGENDCLGGDLGTCEDDGEPIEDNDCLLVFLSLKSARLLTSCCSGVAASDREPNGENDC
jgi:hypothetical protein